jgi:hypothetical protein
MVPNNNPHIMNSWVVIKTASVVRVPVHRSRGPGFDSGRYQIFWEVVGQERGPLSLVSTMEELLGRNNSGSENKAVGIRCAYHATPL